MCMLSAWFRACVTCVTEEDIHSLISLIWRLGCEKHWLICFMQHSNTRTHEQSIQVKRDCYFYFTSTSTCMFWIQFECFTSVVEWYHCAVLRRSSSSRGLKLCDGAGHLINPLWTPGSYWATVYTGEKHFLTCQSPELQWSGLTPWWPSAASYCLDRIWCCAATTAAALCHIVMRL